MRRDVRIIGIELENIRSFKHSKLEIPISDYHEMNNVKGLFGENGSGKTTVIDVLHFLRGVITGNQNDVLHHNLVNVNSEKASIKISFCLYDAIDIDENTDLRDLEKLEEYTLDYYVEFTAHFLLQEKIFIEGKESYTYNFQHNFHALAFKDNLANEFVSEVYDFFSSKLFIIREQDFIRDGYNIVLGIDNKLDISDSIKLFDWFRIPFEDMVRNVSRLTELILHRKIFIEPMYSTGNQCMLRVSNLDTGDVIDFRHESLGIKRAITLMFYLVRLQSERNMCLCVDEIENGIFELMLKNLISVFNGPHTGQLIFTSHSLTLLRVLDGDDLMFVQEGKFVKPQGRDIFNKYVKYYGDNKRIVPSSRLGYLFYLISEGLDE